LETALRRGRLCCALSVRQYGAQATAPHRSHDRTAGCRAAAAASLLGKQRIADELAKANNWVPIVSPNTVKRILIDAGLWTPREASKKGASRPSVEQQTNRAKP
jgi:hypothetical protein